MLKPMLGTLAQVCGENKAHQSILMLIQYHCMRIILDVLQGVDSPVSSLNCSITNHYRMLDAVIYSLKED